MLISLPLNLNQAFILILPLLTSTEGRSPSAARWFFIWRRVGNVVIPGFLQLITEQAGPIRTTTTLILIDRKNLAHQSSCFPPAVQTGAGKKEPAVAANLWLRFPGGADTVSLSAPSSPTSPPKGAPVCSITIWPD